MRYLSISLRRLLRDVRNYVIRHVYSRLMFVIDDTANLWDRGMRNWGWGVLDAWSKMCVDGGGASHWVLIPAIFRVDADVLSSLTWEMQVFSFSWLGISILCSSGIRRRVIAYYTSTPVFWRHTIFASTGYKKVCPSWHRVQFFRCFADRASQYNVSN